ncbi:hypothetical protein EYF80_010362 [Liparis tanakae]|uniref:Uncharacterized protein n=1 Tax=Liparis tanakae TaxID=230148 RepID=A0A4Z2INV7_9TELE|nr:hypothetical protein EYF80_010362 [Liparis tanakae]
MNEEERGRSKKRNCFMSGSRDHARSPYSGAPLPSSPVTAQSHSSVAGGYIPNTATTGEDQ